MQGNERLNIGTKECDVKGGINEKWWRICNLHEADGVCDWLTTVSIVSSQI
jgi:hypothetical protein